MSETRLQAFMEASNIRPLQLAAESGVCRQALRLLRRGEQEPHVSTVAAIVRACRRLSGRAVRAADLFDLGDASTNPHHLVGVTEPRPSLPLPLPSSATRLAAFIWSHGFSRADVAVASDLSKNRVSAYFHGVDARLTNVRKLCAGLSLLLGRHVRPDEVFDLGEDERDPRVRHLRRRKRRP